MLASSLQNRFQNSTLMLFKRPFSDFKKAFIKFLITALTSLALIAYLNLAKQNQKSP